MILQTIKEVRFPNLKTLFVGDNNVESVEGLNRVYLPQLKFLGIRTSANI